MLSFRIGIAIGRGSARTAAPLSFRSYAGLVPRNVPGEADQQNSLASRLPKFPLGKETIPTLLPKPGVPQLGPNCSFADAIKILKTSKHEELIYEAEPHRLYFIACFCAAFVFAVYGLTFVENTGTNAVKLYRENPECLPEDENKMMLAGRLGVTLAMFSVPACAVLFFVKFPSRLVRRIYYLPGPVEHVKIISHPMIPGRPTPVYTIPLEKLTRHQKSKVWTGRGFYGTLDNGSFFFRLKEQGKRATWIVDRKGFFWVDGRVYDYLFGKESLKEAEAGISYDQKHALASRDLKKKKEQMRKELGVAWQLKMQAQIMKEDIQVAKGFVTGKSQEKLEAEAEGARLESGKAKIETGETKVEAGKTGVETVVSVGKSKSKTKNGKGKKN